ncbi:hypothetical protein Tco_1455876 [Tanacetum coccineum]
MIRWSALLLGVKDCYDVTPSNTYSVQAPSRGVIDWYQSQDILLFACYFIAAPAVEMTLCRLPTRLCGLVLLGSDSDSPDEMSSPEHISPLPAISPFLCTDSSEAPDSSDGPPSQDPYITTVALRRRYNSKSYIII